MIVQSMQSCPPIFTGLALKAAQAMVTAGSRNHVKIVKGCLSIFCLLFPQMLYNFLMLHPLNSSINRQMF